MVIEILAGMLLTAAGPDHVNDPILDPIILVQPTELATTLAYPKQAFSKRINGKVALDCEIDPGFRPVDCRVIEETPQGLGFSQAAYRLTKSYRFGPISKSGVNQIGARVRFVLRFSTSE